MNEYESDLFRVRPIDRWPGDMTPDDKRTMSPFYAQYEQTLYLLERELHALRARHPVLQIAVQPEEIRLDGLPRASARPRHPGVILSFDSKFGPLSYSCDSYRDWKHNLRAVALSLEALRKVDRYGVSKSGQQYTGWKRLEESSMSYREAVDLITSYGGEKEALRRTHPDHGGSREDFDRVMRARRLLADARKVSV